MGNMDLYNKLRIVPDEAKRTIQAGRLKGFTDINPMWRIKALTEAFGACGFGWWYKIIDKRIELYDNEYRAFIDIELYYVLDGKVSQPVVGTGGASFVTMEKNGAYVSDECYKMALTDAISVAAKSLGVGADVYYEKDCDKYSTTTDGNKKTEPDKPKPEPVETKATTTQNYVCSECNTPISKDEYTFSMKFYHASLCREHQRARNRR